MSGAVAPAGPAAAALRLKLARSHEVMGTLQAEHSAALARLEELAPRAERADALEREAAARDARVA